MKRIGTMRRVFPLLIFFTLSVTFSQDGIEVFANDVLNFIHSTIKDSNAVLIVNGREVYNTLLDVNTYKNLEIVSIDSIDSIDIEKIKKSDKILLTYGICHYSGLPKDSLYIFGYVSRYFSIPPNENEIIKRCAKSFLSEQQNYSFVKDKTVERNIIRNFSVAVLNTALLIKDDQSLADSLIFFFINNDYYRYLPVFCVALVIKGDKGEIRGYSPQLRKKLLSGVKEWLTANPNAFDRDYWEQQWKKLIKNEK